MFFAPVGAEPPSLASAPTPEGWLPLSKATDLSLFQHRFAEQPLNTQRSPSMELPSPEEIEAARSSKSGYSRAQLAARGRPMASTEGAEGRTDRALEGRTQGRRTATLAPSDPGRPRTGDAQLRLTRRQRSGQPRGPSPHRYAHRMPILDSCSIRSGESVAALLR